jgi:hypothetical protein
MEVEEFPIVTKQHTGHETHTDEATPIPGSE